VEAFDFGPFTFSPGRAMRVAGEASQRWAMTYGHDEIAEHVIPSTTSRDNIIETFNSDRSTFINRAARQNRARREPSGAYAVALVRSTDTTGCRGETIACVDAYAPIPGMSAGLIDDRFETWAISEIGVVPMTRREFDLLASASAVTAEAISTAEAMRAEANARLPHEWITRLLPNAVLTDDHAEWRAPSSWEIRHVVGEGSFTHVTGAKAAELVGVTPQNFRKYTARDGARTRQAISFAMWHLLLHKLGVQHA